MKTNLIEYFQETVVAFSNKVAIDDNQDSMTFLELNEISDKVAIIIRSKTIVRIPVAVFLPKNRWSVVSFIGIFKSGNF